MALTIAFGRMTLVIVFGWMDWLLLLGGWIGHCFWVDGMVIALEVMPLTFTIGFIALLSVLCWMSLFPGLISSVRRKHFLLN